MIYRSMKKLGHPSLQWPYKRPYFHLRNSFPNAGFLNKPSIHTYIYVHLNIYIYTYIYINIYTHTYIYGKPAKTPRYLYSWKRVKNKYN